MPRGSNTTAHLRFDCTVHMHDIISGFAEYMDTTPRQLVSELIVDHVTVLRGVSSWQSTEMTALWANQEDMFGKALIMSRQHRPVDAFVPKPIGQSVEQYSAELNKPPSWVARIIALHGLAATMQEQRFRPTI